MRGFRSEIDAVLVRADGLRMRDGKCKGITTQVVDNNTKNISYLKGA